MVVTKDGTKTKRKRKKAKKASPDAKGKEETAAAATKSDENRTTSLRRQYLSIVSAVEVRATR